VTAIRIQDPLLILQDNVGVGYAEVLNFASGASAVRRSDGTIDVTVQSSEGSYIVVDGSVPPTPSSRALVRGPGIVFTDDPNAGTLSISVDPAYIQRIKWNEVPDGPIDSTNRTFVLQHSPVSEESLMFFVNGVLQRFGPAGDCDYVLSGSAIVLTTLLPPRTNDLLTVTYQY